MLAVELALGRAMNARNYKYWGSEELKQLVLLVGA
jgi:hypothetical protein